MAELLRKPINEDHLFYVQRLDYQIGGCLTLLRTMMREEEYPYTSEHYQHFMKQYDELVAEYNLALLELKHFYAPELEGSLAITVDAVTEEVVFSEQGGHSHSHSTHSPTCIASRK